MTGSAPGAAGEQPTTGHEMEDILTSFIEQQFHDQGDDVTLEPDDDLVVLGFDSIAYVRLIAFIKEQFGIQVPDSEVTVEQFGTVEAMVGYLGQRLDQGRATG
jgi:acyl carrier protein